MRTQKQCKESYGYCGWSGISDNTKVVPTRHRRKKTRKTTPNIPLSGLCHRQQEQTLFKDLQHGNGCKKKENLEKYEKSKREEIKTPKISEKIFKVKF